MTTTSGSKDGPPSCPNCQAVFHREVAMRGPVDHPVDQSLGRFYVCDRCNHTTKAAAHPAERPGARAPRV